jgi:hypothetical protein
VVADLNTKILRKLGVSRDELFAAIGWRSNIFHRRLIRTPMNR